MSHWAKVIHAQNRLDVLMAASSSESDAAVCAVEAAYDQAWRRGDVDALMACFPDDAVLVNPRGEVAVGTSQIRGAFESLFANEAKGSVHDSHIVRVTFVTEDVAVVDGEAVIEGFRDGEREATTDFTWRINQIRA